MTWDRETARSYAGLGRQHHVAILRPIIGELFGDLEGRRVLDFGCGPGRLSVALAEECADEVVAVDANAEMVRQARELVEGRAETLRRRISVSKGDETDLEQLGPFDAALSSLALMMCDSRDRLHRTSRNLLSVLRPGGRLVAVITHPCFRAHDYGTFRYDIPEDFEYWHSGSPYRVVMSPSDEGPGDDVTITDYHWTLEDYCGALIGPAAMLSGIRELPAVRRDDGSPDGPPAYLVLQVERRTET